MDTPPVEDTKYPLLHSVLKCLPQYGKEYLLCKEELDLDFKAPITDDRQSLGLVERIRWIWSDSPLISVMSTPISLAIDGNI